MNEINLIDNPWIEFKDIDSNLGRAEFTICTQYKRGKLIKAYIYTRQQKDRADYWVWEGKADGLCITAYQLDHPKIWITHWCKEHRCQTLELYVPPESKCIQVHRSVGKLCIDFHRKLLPSIYKT